MVLRSIAVRICESEPDLKLNVWYLDDGTLVGKAAYSARVLVFLERDARVQECGLRLDLPKSEMWWPMGERAQRSS